MAFGDCEDDAALRAAWKDFCGKLEKAGDGIFKDYNPANGLQRADALRFLTQNLGQAFDLALETKNTKYPVIHNFCTPFCKLGGDNADYTYQQAWIDGESVYRISGNKGTARFFNIAVQGPRPEFPPGRRGLHDPFGDTPEANLFGHDMVTGWDGSFEVYIGGPERGPNWLPTTPGSRKLFIRQGFDAWSELPAQMRIERVGMDSPRPMPSAARMAEAMDWAGRFVTGFMADWPEHSWNTSGGVVDPDNPNQFPADKSANTADDAKRGRMAANLIWSLEPDEALIVEMDNHDGFWLFGMNAFFVESMDYLYRSTSFAPARTKIDSDDVVRFVIAHDDPGVHNWLDTQGFSDGNLGYRNLMSQNPATFRTKLVKRAELMDHLPADTAMMSPEERSAELLTRYRAIKRRFAI